MTKRKHIYILVHKFGSFEYNTLEATPDAGLYSYDIYGDLYKNKGSYWELVEDEK